MNEKICKECSAPVNDRGEYVNLTVKRIDPNDPEQRKLTEWLDIE